MNRLENIKNFGMKKMENELLNEMTSRQHLAETTFEIESLWDRAKEMILAYNTCRVWDIKIPEFSAKVLRYHELLYGYMCVDTKGIYLVNHNRDDWRISLRDGKVDFHLAPVWMIDDFADAFNELEDRFYRWIDENLQ